MKHIFESPTLILKIPQDRIDEMIPLVEPHTDRVENGIDVTKNVARYRTYRNAYDAMKELKTMGWHSNNIIIVSNENYAHVVMVKNNIKFLRLLI